MNESFVSRRAMLCRSFSGMGAMGLAAVLGHSRSNSTCAAESAESLVRSPLAAKIGHFPAKAKHVIHLWMNGAPSQVDTFDPKPALAKYAGQRPPSTAHLTTENQTGGLMPSPFRFTRYGESGIEVSELFPEVGRFADDLCVIRSMHTTNPVHESSNWMMFTGSVQPVRPSYGSWLLYGLGTENENLPGFVVLGEGQPVNGPSNWSSRFLPGVYQGCQITLPEVYEPAKVIPYLHNTQIPIAQQRRELDFIQQLNRDHLQQRGAENAMSARIASLELAFRMQTQASEAFDVSQESAATFDLYGLTGTDGQYVADSIAGKFQRSIYGRNCLLARRLIERGVRVVQIYCGKSQPWDTHSKNTEGHRSLSHAVDRPIAGLLADLKQRGLLDETLVVWGGEFGRTPATQGSDGRDHNHHGFSVWLAGGGIRGGLIHGATDEFGYEAIDKRMHVHDLHATMLHLMGLNHEKLTYRYSGRDYRLTDVHGQVAKQILA